MGTTTTKPTTHVRYEEDFVAWAAQTALLLRERRFDEIDMESLAEEVDAMAGRDRREVLSRLTVLLVHLLKWKHQPDKRSRSWQSTIATQRAELDDLFEDSPSLKRGLAAAVSRAYPRAADLAAIETGLSADTFPPKCPFTLKQILDPAYQPE